MALCPFLTEINGNNGIGLYFCFKLNTDDESSSVHKIRSTGSASIERS